MKMKLFASMCVMAVLSVMPSMAASLGVTASATHTGGLYDYSYVFTISGTGLSVDTLFLGSDDLSPLNVAFIFDGNTSTNWSWLGNDTPQNYLEFFSTNASTLSAGDTLDVTFASALAPASGHFAIGLNSGTSATSNEVTGVLAPTAVPEAATYSMLGLGLALVGLVRFRSRR